MNLWKLLNKLLCVCLLILTFISIWWRTWLAEDAFITFRYVENWLNGYGLVFNMGERVEGFTSPLWMVFLAGGNPFNYLYFLDKDQG